MPAKYVTRFITFTKFILITLYLLILVGSIVRATGSGMGCPDWPKCFGSWVPPSDVSQLPENYKEIYGTETVKVAEFSALHTWIEYINRLVGVLLGFFVFGMFILSWRMIKFDRIVFILSFLQLLLMGFQGWLGSLVVSSNLAAAKITAHMMVALVIIAVQILIIYRAKTMVKDEVKVSFGVKGKIIIIAALLISLVQIFFGTEVREEIDKIAFNMGNQHRNTWIALLGNSFDLHRFLAVAVLLINGFIYYLVRINHPNSGRINVLAKYILGFIIFQMMIGFYMAYFGIPAFTQPIHLLLATIMFGLQFALLIRVLERRAI